MLRSRSAVVAFLLFLCAGTILGATPATKSPQPLQSLLDRVKKDCFLYADPSSPLIGATIETQLDKKHTAPEIIHHLSVTFAMKEADAAKVLRVWARAKLAMEAAKEESTTTKSELAAVAAQWKNTFQSLRTDAVAREYLEFLIESGNENRDQEMQRVLTASPDGAAVAISLLSGTFDREVESRLTEFAARTDSTNPLLLIKLGRDVHPTFALSAYEHRFALGALDTLQKAALAEEALDAYLYTGHSREAIALFESLDQATQAVVIGDAKDYPGWTYVTRGVVRAEVQRKSTGYALAGAYVLLGDRQRADTILKGIATAEERLNKRDVPSMAHTLRDLLSAEVSGQKVDPFEIAASFVASIESHEGDVNANEVILQVFSRFAIANGYERVAQYMLNRAHRIQNWRDPRVQLPESLARMRDRWSAPTIEEQKEDSSHAKALPNRIFPYREREPSAASAAPADCNSVERLKTEGVVFPDEIEPLRAERRGQTIVALSVSQAVDPVGEVSMGGYWIVRSNDGGWSWDPPLYTGLRQYDPYVLAPSSNIPMFNEEGLTLEATVQQLNRESITFPPVALKTVGTSRKVVLEISWADLLKDRDHDALPDLLEDRLLTDPSNADTDGDGVLDGDDPLPQVAFSATESAESEVLEQLLSPDAPKVGGALITGIAEEGESESCSQPRVSQGEPGATFVIGDRKDFAAMRSTSRIVVLTPAEWEMAEQKFGDFFPASFSIVVVDPTGTKAVVAMNESWRANVYRLEKKNGRWISKVIGGWIS